MCVPKNALHALFKSFIRIKMGTEIVIKKGSAGYRRAAILFLDNSSVQYDNTKMVLLR